MSTWVIMPSDDDIEHGFHKYIDKIRTASGKWRYIYYKTKKNARNAVGLNQKKKLEIAEGGLKKSVDKLEKSDNSNVQKNYDAAKQHKEKYDKRKEEFNNTLLGKIDSVKNKGLKIFDDLFGTNLSKEDLSKVNLRHTNKHYIPEDTIKENVISEKKIIGANGFGGYKPKKGPTTSTRGTAYSPSGKTTVTNKNSGGTAYSPKYQSSGRQRATNFMKNASKKTNDGNKVGMVGFALKKYPNAAIGSDLFNEDKKKKRKRV